MAKKKIFFCLLALILLVACSKESDNENSKSKNLTIFFVNDQHGQVENFSKIKYIIDQEKEEGNVIVACSGDMFSGNPVVDNYEAKGYPMIDIMNSIPFDVATMGNHEFDYGEQALKERMEQADFDWVCANIDMGYTGVPEPFEYKTLTIDDLRITFLGLIETNGKPDAVIPSTHPWKVEHYIFERPENVVSEFAALKEQEKADLYIALTHLGHTGYHGTLGDFQLAEQFPYFDIIIGGHSHYIVDTTINNIPIFQAGGYLYFLGKIEVLVKNKTVEEVNFELIDLNTYPDYNAEVKTLIDEYDAEMSVVLDEVIGYSYASYNRHQLGCFYTDAIRARMEVDVSFQNPGGIRSSLDEGAITVREIYEIDPFNNGAVIYNLTVADIKEFLIESGSGFYYSGIQITQIGSEIEIRDLEGNVLEDNSLLTLGINDYIPAVYDSFFDSDPNIQPYTMAEAIVYYLENINDQVNIPIAIIISVTSNYLLKAMIAASATLPLKALIILRFFLGLIVI